MRSELIALLLPVLLGQSAKEQVDKEFRFKVEQSVYVVAVETTSRDLSLTGVNLKIERFAKEQFKKEKKFGQAPTLRQADFVFFVLYDGGSDDADALAIAVLPSDYQRYGQDLDALRIHALWQGEEHFKGSQRARYAAGAGTTLGLSALFYRPNVVKSLVKKFHKDVLKKP